MAHKKESKAKRVSIRVTEKTEEDLNDLAEKTKIPKTTLCNLGIRLLISNLRKKEELIQTEMNIDLSRFCEIYYKNSFNFVMGDIRQTIKESPYDEQALFEMALERGRKLDEEG